METAIMASAIVTLFGSLTAMAAYIKVQHAGTVRRLDKCEEDREELWDHIAKTATASLDRDRPGMEEVKETATARAEGKGPKREKPPSDVPPVLVR
jgi:hypothetical protein